MICAQITISDGGEQLSVALTVNGKTGNVAVALNTDVEVKVVGLDAGSDIDIKNISATPDQSILKGKADSSGVYTSVIQFTVDETVTLQGYYGLLGIDRTNQVNVTAGKGSQDWTKLILPATLLLGGAYLISTFMKPGSGEG